MKNKTFLVTTLFTCCVLTGSSLHCVAHKEIVKKKPVTQNTIDLLTRRLARTTVDETKEVECWMFGQLVKLRMPNTHKTASGRKIEKHGPITVRGLTEEKRRQIRRSLFQPTELPQYPQGSIFSGTIAELRATLPETKPKEETEMQFDLLDPPNRTRANPQGLSVVP